MNWTLSWCKDSFNRGKYLIIVFINDKVYLPILSNLYKVFYIHAWLTDKPINIIY